MTVEPFRRIGIMGSGVWHLVHAEAPSAADGGVVTVCGRRTRGTCTPPSNVTCRCCSARSTRPVAPPARPGAARAPYRHLSAPGR